MKRFGARCVVISYYSTTVRVPSTPALFPLFLSVVVVARASDSIREERRTPRHVMSNSADPRELSVLMVLCLCHAAAGLRCPFTASECIVSPSPRKRPPENRLWFRRPPSVLLQTVAYQPRPQPQVPPLGKWPVQHLPLGQRQTPATRGCLPRSPSSSTEGWGTCRR